MMTLRPTCRTMALAALICLGLFSGLFSEGLDSNTGPQGLSAQAQSLEPLFDHSETRPSKPAHTPPPAKAPSSSSFTLKGSIQTIHTAIAEETHIDWYQWYLSCREYLLRTGGIPCDLGTDIKFHKDGRIEALSASSDCTRSLKRRKFPLPKDTALEAVILPVRPGHAPPASPEEVYSRVKRGQ